MPSNGAWSYAQLEDVTGNGVASPIFRAAAATAFTALALGTLTSPATVASASVDTWMETWTTNYSVPLHPAQPSSPTSAPTPAAMTTAAEVMKVHLRSGLTWDQIARLFGVSRRAVHGWASGSRMSAANTEFLARFVSILETRPNNSAEENRAWLLMGSTGRRGVLDELAATKKSPAPIEDILSLRERLGVQ